MDINTLDDLFNFIQIARAETNLKDLKRIKVVQDDVCGIVARTMDGIDIVGANFSNIE